MALNDSWFFDDNQELQDSVYDAKELFGENTPYRIELRMSGNVTIFNDHFIRTAREALTNGCMAKMSTVESALFIRFVEYQNGSDYRDITREDNEVLVALDQWFMDDLNNIPHPGVNACFDSPTHVWEN